MLNFFKKKKSVNKSYTPNSPSDERLVDNLDALLKSRFKILLDKIHLIVNIAADKEKADHANKLIDGEVNAAEGATGASVLSEVEKYLNDISNASEQIPSQEADASTDSPDSVG